MASTDDKVILKSSEGECFEVDMAVACHLQIVKSVLEDCEGSSDKVVSLFVVEAKYVAMIIEYYKTYVELEEKHEEGGFEEKLKEFEKQFLEQIDKIELKGLVMAVNYLNAPAMFDAVCTTIAKHIENKSVEYVREYFGIVNDFTPEEEAQIREEHRWAYDGVNDD
ncbi:hypothetical protein K2173_012609 [Erythroxylum novogranatense]|uniref:SKP1-like protein n=1 Tax=Erythroxylum novogranatense TaxID=1862640 RepID=A0AAV8T230_9ROSI|nr:hypothetical protein K2173_012609 [Erythroxylum novogranatense]